MDISSSSTHSVKISGATDPYKVVLEYPRKEVLDILKGSLKECVRYAEFDPMWEPWRRLSLYYVHSGHTKVVHLVVAHLESEKDVAFRPTSIITLGE